MSWKDTTTIARWLWKHTSQTADEIAFSLDTWVEWINDALGLPNMRDPFLPAVGTRVIYRGVVGKINNAIRTPIAPSGVLIDVYRWDARDHYVGLVDSSQVS